MKKISERREMCSASFNVKIVDIGRKSKPKIEFSRFNCFFVNGTKEMLCVNWDYLENG